MKIYPIHIKILIADQPGNSFDLTKDIFYENKPNTNDNPNKMTGGDGQDSVLPLFTDEVAYSFEHLTKEEKKQIFFDKSLFESTLRSLPRSTTDIKKHQNAVFNIKKMLEIFFPTYFPVEQNVKNTFEELIEEQPTQSTQSFTIISLFSFVPETLTSVFEPNQKKYSYVTVNGKHYTVLGVTWINDIINHPFYKKMMKSLLDLQKTIKKMVVEIDAKIKPEMVLFETTLSKLKRNVFLLTESEKNDAISEIREQIRLDKRYGRKSSSNYSKMIQYITNIYNNQTNTNIVLDNLGDLFIISKRNNDLPNDLYIHFKPIFKIAGKIRILNWMKEYLENPSGFVSQMKESNEKSEFKTKMKELENEFNKYKDYKKESETLYDLIISKESCNPDLQSIITNFYQQSDMKTLFDLAQYIHLKYIIKDLKPLKFVFENKIFEVGVLNTNPDKNEDDDDDEENAKKESKTKNEPNYEIYIQLDLFNGIIDDSTVSGIKCPYKNDQLIQMYTRLKKKDTIKRNIYGGKKNRKNTRRSY